jgi:hypothetical protein
MPLHPGVTITGTDIKLINTIIHDTAHGVSCSAGSKRAEV